MLITNPCADLIGTSVLSWGHTASLFDSTECGKSNEVTLYGKFAFVSTLVAYSIAILSILITFLVTKKKPVVLKFVVRRALTCCT